MRDAMRPIRPTLPLPFGPILLLAGFPLASHAGTPQYEWTLSRSFTNPDENQGPVTDAPLMLYLWFRSPTSDGMSAAEFRLSRPAGTTSVVFTTHNGFTNVGGPADVRLEVGTCPAGPVIAASWLVVDTVAPQFGDYCLEPTTAGGVLATTDCSGTTWPMTVVCYRSGVEPPGGVHWTISSSSVDPFVNGRAAPSGTPTSLYLWFIGLPGGEPLESATFAFSVPAGSYNFGFTPWNYFINFGTASELILQASCPTGPVVAGTWLVYDAAPGAYSLGDPAGEVAGTTDCAEPPQFHPLGYTPFTVGPVAVTPDSWARVKAQYR